jgi:predicted DNA-binding transcriptional regulator AlpA
MSRARRQIDCPREPIGLSREEAATFIGISATSFERLVDRGEMPQPRKVLGRLIWAASEIEAAFLRLPRAGDDGNGEKPPGKTSGNGWGGY